MQIINNSFTDKRVRRAVRQVFEDRRVVREFGLRCIDKIRERTTEQNIDKRGKAFTGYAKTYVQSTIFDIYGKDKSDVNLTLTGEMLASMDVTDISNKGPIISFVSEEQGKKAEGHIKGIPRFFGNVKGKVSRDFFGLPPEDQTRILKEVVRDFQENRFDFTPTESSVG